MKRSKLFRITALLVCLCFLFVNTAVIAEEMEEDTSLEEDMPFEEGMTDDFYDEDTHDSTGKIEEVETEEAPIVILDDEGSVNTDVKNLDIGFLRCVSRDLVLPQEGKNGTKIMWKSSNPNVITNEGKYIKPKKITEVTLTATVQKGAYKKTKSFNLTVNRRSMYDVMMDYVETMIKYGRDDHYFTPEEYANANRVEVMTDAIGKNVKSSKSGLFFSMLERDTLKYPAYYVTDWPIMTFNYDERASGCETAPDIWLYEMLYDITAMTGDESYAKIADDNLYFFLENCRHPSSGVLAWGLHMLYDPVAGCVNAPNQYATSQAEKDTWSNYTEPGDGDRYMFRNPFLVEKFFELNFEAWEQYMLSYYSSTLANKKDFSFSRHTKIDGGAKASGNYASMMNPMAFAYTWGNIFSGDAQFSDALHSMMNWLERLSGMNENYLFAQEIYVTNNRFHGSWMRDCIYAAVWFRELAPLVPEDIAERMIKYSDFVIDEIMGYNPDLTGRNRFYSDYDIGNGLMNIYRDAFRLPQYQEMWLTLKREGDERAETMEEWMTDWAEDFGFTKLENKLSETDYFPRTLADEMYFHLDMYEGTSDEKYLDRALEYADFAIYDLWELESLLPAMTHAQKKYYESNWGSVEVVKAIWDAYFLDIERKTGVHPINDAWEKKGYTTKDILDLKDKEVYDAFMEKNKSITSVLR